MTKKSLNITSLVSWLDSPPPHNTQGVISQHVTRPHFIEITPKGGWAVLTLGKDDKPVFVARGNANNVARAKQDATTAAIAKVPELKAAITAVNPQQNENTQRVYLVSARRATWRWYGSLATFSLGSVWLIWLLATHRPKVIVMFVMLLCLGLYLAHVLTTMLERANTKREKLVKAQQARAMVAQAKANGQPKPPKMLGRG